MVQFDCSIKKLNKKFINRLLNSIVRWINQVVSSEISINLIFD